MNIIKIVYIYKKNINYNIFFINIYIINKITKYWGIKKAVGELYLL